MKMGTPLNLLICKIKSLNRLATPICRQYYKTLECQSSFVPENNGNANKYHKSVTQILDSIPPESEALSPSDTLNIFRRLREAQQTNSSHNVTGHKNFNVLCRALKVSMPYLEMNAKLDILNAIKSLSVPIDVEISNTILSSFYENLFNMSLNDIMILDRLLFFCQKSQMVDDLHRSLIDRFNLKSSTLKIEFNYFMQMRRMLQFIERNQLEIIEEVFDNMRNCAANQHIDILTPYEAMDAMILLSSFGNRSECMWPILNRAFDVWCNSEITMRMVEIVLRILVRRNRYGNDISRYNDSRFIGTCTRTAITNGDVEKCFLVLRCLNQLELTSQQLIDFLLDRLKETRTHKRFVYNCATISIACDIANYRPAVFHEFLLPLLSAMNFHQQFDFHLNWPKFALTLQNLGIQHRPLINEIFKRRPQFVTYHGFDVLECLEMERLLNANIQHLLPQLKHAIGEYVRLLVSTDNDGIIIPLLLKIDIHSKKLIPFGDGSVILMNSMNSIPCRDNQLLIALVKSDPQDMHPLRSNVITIALDSSEWIDVLQCRTHEALFNEIYNHIEKQKADSKQMNLF